MAVVTCVSFLPPTTHSRLRRGIRRFAAYLCTKCDANGLSGAIVFLFLFFFCVRAGKISGLLERRAGDERSIVVRRKAHIWGRERQAYTVARSSLGSEPNVYRAFIDVHSWVGWRGESDFILLAESRSPDLMRGCAGLRQLPNQGHPLSPPAP